MVEPGVSPGQLNMLIAFQRDLAFERARASGHCSGDLDYINIADSVDMYNVHVLGLQRCFVEWN